MKNIFAVLVILSLCSFKGDIPAKPEYFGTWRSVFKNGDKIMESVMTLKQNSKSNKIDFYRKKDTDGIPLYTVKMTDESHFKGSKTESISADISVEHNVTGYFADSKLYTEDNEEQKNYATKQMHNNSVSHVYKKWDPASQKYIDFPNESIHAVTN